MTIERPPRGGHYVGVLATHPGNDRFRIYRLILYHFIVRDTRREMWIHIILPARVPSEVLGKPYLDTVFCLVPTAALTNS